MTATTRTSIDLTIPDHAWAAGGGEGEERTFLLAHVYINGTGFHLSAIEIDVTGQPVGNHSEMLDGLYNIFGSEGFYETTEIAGRQYVLFGDPDC